MSRLLFRRILAATLSFCLSAQPVLAQMKFRVPLDPGIAQATGHLQLDAESVSFGTVALGVSETRTVKLSNPGDASLTLRDIALTGEGFSKWTDCGAYLAPGAECQLMLVFQPSVKKNYAGEVNITSGNSTVPSRISLTGTGQGGQLSVTPGSVSFSPAVQVGLASTAQLVTVTNTGVGPVSDIQVSVVNESGAADFTQSNNCGSTLQRNDTCQVVVGFTAMAAGTRNAVLAVASNSAAELDTVSLTGSGVLPSATLAPATYGVVQVGSSRTATSEFKNTGVGPLTLESVSVSAGAFSLVSHDCPTTLSPTQTCTVTTRFAPTTAGADSGTLSVKVREAAALTTSLSGSGQLGSATLSAVSFAAAPVGQESTATATLTNTGIDALSVVIPSTTSVTGTDFRLASTTCGATLAAEASCDVVVTFAPQTMGTRTGTLTVITGAGERSTPLSAVGQVVAFTVAPSSLDLGEAAVGQLASSALVTVTNTGNLPVQGLATQATGGYSVTGFTCSANLAPGETCQFRASLTPGAAQRYDGNVQVTAANTALTQTVEVTAQGVLGELAVSTTSLAFSATQVGQVSSSSSVTLTNTGNVALGLSAPTASGDFRVSSTTCLTSLPAGQSCQVSVAFAPTSVATSLTGTLTLANDGLSGTKTVTLSGRGQAQSATLTDIAFASLSAGDSATRVSTLTNTGVGPLSVTVPTSGSVTGTGFSFVSTTCGTSVAVGGSCTVTVSLAVSSNQTYNGTLTVSTGAGNLTSALSGTGTRAVLSFTPASLASFGDVQMGQSATSTQLTLTNSGNATATSLAISTPAGFSVQGSSCGATLAAGTSCTLSVRFSPVAEQPYAGNLTATAAAPAANASLAVAGNGVGQSATLSAVSFGSRTVGEAFDLPATLTNTGVGPLSVTVPTSGSVTGTGFSFVSTTCTSSLASGASCVVTVRFSPSSHQAYTGTLSVTTGAGLKTAALTGSGTRAVLSFSPSTLADFGTVQVGDSKVSATVTLTNTGNASATGLALTAPTGFAIQSTTCGASLAASASCTLSVRFSPASEKAYSDTLTASAAAPAVSGALGVSGTGAGQSATLENISFGSRTAGATTDLSATLANTGAGALSLVVPTASSVTGTGFSFVSTTCASSLPAGDSCTVTVRFSPTLNSAYSGSLTVSTGAGVKTGTLSGTGTRAVLTFSPSSLSAFGDVQVGQTQDSAQVTLSNTGNATAASLAVTAPTGFSLQSSTCSTSLAAGASCTMTVRFSPTAVQAYSGNLSATATAPAVGTSLSLSGTGVAQAATLGDVSFGGRTSGTTVDLTSTLTNTGAGPLSVTVPTSGSVTGTGFSFVSTTCTTSLAVAGTCTVTVRFSPTANQDYTGSLSVTTGAGVKTAALSGTGTRAVLVFSPSTLAAFGDVQVGQSADSASLTLSNTGNATAASLAVTAPTGFSLQSSTCSTSLAAGASCTMAVRFSPTAAQAYSGNLSATATSPAVGTTLALGGTGVSQTATLSNVSFGSRAVNLTPTLTSTLTNTGVGPLSVTVPTAGSVTGTGFSFVSTTCTSTLAAAGTCTVTVRFSPTANQTYTGSLSVTTGAGVKTATLSGTGTRAVLAFSPSSLTAFGNVQVGQSADSVSLTLSNTGNATAASLAVTAPTGFSLQSSTCSTSLAAGASCTMTVRFSPAAAQAYSGNLSATATSPAVGSTVALSGTGVAQAASLGALSFGSRASGSTTDLAATLTNTGAGPLSVTVPTSGSVTGTGFSFVSTTCTSTLAVGGTCAVTVRFSPTASQSYSGTLTVSTGAGSLNAALSGTGLQGTGTASATDLAFGSVQVGQTSTSQSVTMTNNGTQALTFSGISVVTGFADFGQSNNCGATLAVGASCTIQVAMTPSTAGALSGVLVALHDGPGGRTDITLSGTGVAASGTLSSLSFGNKVVDTTANVLTSTLTNTGLGPLSVTVPTAGSVTGTGFSFVSTTCTTSLAVAGTCTVSVRFSPTAAQAYTGTLTVATGAGSLAANLSGTGTRAALVFSPSTLSSFGNVQVGQTADSALVTLTNTGASEATSLSLTAPTGFSLQSSTCSTSLAAGASCTMTVRFSPAAAQAYSGNLTATAAAPALGASLALGGTGVAQAATLSDVSFGSRTSGTTLDLTSTLTNTGSGPLTVTVPTAGSVTGAGFSFVSTTCTSSLAVAGTCSVTVRFSPTANQDYTGSLSVTTGAGVKTATLSGTGTRAVLTFSPSTLTAFGNVQVGQSADSVSLTLSNTGNATAAALAVSVPTGFSLQSSTCSTSLAAGASCTMNVRFSPTAVQAYSGNLSATATSPAVGATVALSGTGVAQSATLSNVSFGNRAVNLTPTLTSTLTNTGAGPLSVTVPTAGSVTGTGFSFVSTTCTTSLAVAGTCTVTVRFSPTANQTYTGSLSVTTGAGVKTATLSGTGTRAVLGFTPSTLSAFPDVQVGQSQDSVQVTLANSGNASAASLAVTVPTGFSLQSSTCSTSLAAGASCTMTVRFSPAAAQAYSGSLSATATSPAVGATVVLSGTGVAQAATMSAVDFGSVDANTTADLTSTLTNSGVGPLSVTVPTSGSVTGTGFSFVSTTCTSTLAVGASCATTVRFSPTGSQSYTGSLAVTTGAGVKTAALTGAGALGALEFTPATLAAFGNVQVGQSADSTLVTLTNVGNGTSSGIALAAPVGFSIQGSTCGSSLSAGASCSFTVRFSPVALTDYTGILSANAGVTGWDSISLSGTGVSQSATLSNVSFGSRTSGTTFDLTSTLANTGVGPLSVTVPTSSSVSGSTFSFVSTTCGTSVAVGGSCTVTVRFSPTGNQDYTGSLSVSTGSGVKTATLSGTSTRAVLSITPSPLASFGDVQVGQTKDSALITVTNTGNATATSLAFVTPTGFTLQGSTCGTSLAVGASCTMTARFAPTLVQAYSGNLRASAASPAVAGTGVLSGNGVSQAASLSAVSFGNRSTGTTTDLTSTLTNTGAGPLSVTVPTSGSVTGTGFSFVSTTCTSSLAVGGTCTVTVRFSPTTNVAYSGTLSVTTGAGVKTAALSGTGTRAVLAFSPSTLTAFGNVQVGQSADSVLVTLTNSGNVAASSLALTVPTGFSLVNNTCTTTLAAAASCSFKVRFAPTAVQAYSGNLSVSATAPAVAASMAVSGSGVAQAATLGSLAFGVTNVNSSLQLSTTLTNTGVGPLSLTTPTASSVTGTGFSFVSTTCGTSLDPGITCSVTVQFTPPDALSYSGTVAIQTGAGTLSRSLTGSGQRAVLQLTPSTVPALSTQAGTPVYTETLTLTNVGNGPSGTLVFAPPYSFSIESSTCATTLAAGASCTFKVKYDQYMDLSNQSLHAAGISNYMTISSGTPHEGVSVWLSGTTYAPKATLSAISFGDLQMGSSQTATATLTNTGVGPFSLTVPTSDSVTGTGFSFVSTTCASSLAVDASCTVTVRFSPTSNIAYSGSLSLTTVRGVLVAALDGTGNGTLPVTQISLNWSSAGLAYSIQSVNGAALGNLAKQKLIFSRTGSQAAPSLSLYETSNYRVNESSGVMTRVAVLGTGGATTYYDNGAGSWPLSNWTAGYSIWMRVVDSQYQLADGYLPITAASNSQTWCVTWAQSGTYGPGYWTPSSVTNGACGGEPTGGDPEGSSGGSTPSGTWEWASSPTAVVDANGIATVNGLTTVRTSASLPSSGMWYWEVTASTAHWSSGFPVIGVSTSTTGWPGQYANNCGLFGYNDQNYKESNGSEVRTTDTPVATTPNPWTFGVAYNAGTRTATFYRGGVNLGTCTVGGTATTFPSAGAGSSSSVATFTLNASPTTVPSGYTRLSSATP